MHILSIIFLSLAANVDNFAVAIAYGIKRLRIGLAPNLFIAFVSAMGTFLSISVGVELSRALNLIVANALGSAILVAVGIWGIWGTLRRDRQRLWKTARMQQENSLLITAASGQPHSDVTQEDNFPELMQAFSYESFMENPEKADRDRSGSIDVREAIALAFGLTLNNLGVGLGAGISALDVSWITGLTFALSVLSLSLGYALGKRALAKVSGLWSGLISAGIIVVIGLYEYFVI